MEWLTHSRSVATLNAWARALRHFQAFCQHSGEPCVPPSPTTQIRFVDYLCRSRSLAVTTADRIWGDLGQAIRLLHGDLSSSFTTSLVRKGLRMARSLPAAPPPGLPISRLLRACLAMPRHSKVQRRDFALVLLALLLGARSADLVRVGRDDSRLLQLEESVVRLRLVRDKGSALSGRSVSRFLILPRLPDLDVGPAISSILSDVPRQRVVAHQRSQVVWAPLFVRLDEDGFGRPLQVETVARILGRFLASVGVEGVQAHPRHIRSYAASSAYELGVPLDEVCLHFRWASEESFLRHYHRWDVEAPLRVLPPAPRDGSRVVLAFQAALRRLQRHRGGR